MCARERSSSCSAACSWPSGRIWRCEAVDRYPPMDMATVSEHYATHLAPVYLWMSGGFERAIALGRSDLESLHIDLSRCTTAVDLGAGFGMHAIPLAQDGCSVTAIDTSAVLLDELRNRSAGLPVRIVAADVMDIEAHVHEAVPLVLCMGDTITHLQTLDD